MIIPEIPVENIKLLKFKNTSSCKSSYVYASILSMNFIFLLLFVMPLQSLAEGYPWGRFESLAINKTSAALELREMDFLQDQGKVVIYQIDLNNWKASLIDRKTYDANFAAAKKSSAKKLDWSDSIPLIKLESGESLKIDYENCQDQEEQRPFCRKQILTLNKEKFPLSPPCDGCDILIARKWDQQLWLGLGSHGELEWYGKGFRVEDLKTKKRIFEYSEEVMNGQLPSIMMTDPKEAQMWVATSNGVFVFDKSFKKIHECPLIVPTEHRGKFKFSCDDKQ